MRTLLNMLLVLVLMLGVVPEVQADEISINIDVVAKDDVVRVLIKNVGQDPVRGLNVKLELDGKFYEDQVAGTLPPQKSKTVRFSVSYPSKRGTHPLITTVSYLNEGKRLSLLNVGPFHYAGKNTFNSGITLPKVTLRDRGSLSLVKPEQGTIRLLLPNEVEVEEKIERDHTVQYKLKNNRPEFNSRYTIYALVEHTNDPLNALHIVTGSLTTKRQVKSNSLIATYLFAYTAAVGFLLALGVFSKARKESDFDFEPQLVALIRWGFSLAVFSTIFFLFRTLHVVPEWFTLYVSPHVYPETKVTSYLWNAVQTLMNWLYFEGNNYDHFINFVLDPLYLYLVFGHYFVIRHFYRPKPEEDKMWHLMLTVFTVPKLLRLKKPHWTRLSRLALLALAVKCFYVPLLSSWCISNIFHLQNMLNGFKWEFYFINRFLVDLFIFVDVSFFAVGYLVEFPQLRNQIKSVEPTILGWTVCLMCYPPFNSFSFQPFDYSLSVLSPAAAELWSQPGGYAPYVAKVLITLLWLIYTWATVALGWKCSNLTNRGIVSKGPYAFVRHPAYASKTLLWAIAAFTFGDKNFFLVLTLFTIYAIRAWTEERHLSQDPDYVKYRKKVKWWFYPKVI